MTFAQSVLQSVLALYGFGARSNRRRPAPVLIGHRSLTR